MTKRLTIKQLKQLRSEIVLCSLYMSDYENSFLTKEEAYNLFDGYADFLENLMFDKIEDFNDSKYFDYLDMFDNMVTLTEYYYYYYLA